MTSTATPGARRPDDTSTMTTMATSATTARRGRGRAGRGPRGFSVEDGAERRPSALPGGPRPTSRRPDRGRSPPGPSLRRRFPSRCRCPLPSALAPPRRRAAVASSSGRSGSSRRDAKASRSRAQHRLDTGRGKAHRRGGVPVARRQLSTRTATFSPTPPPPSSACGRASTNTPTLRLSRTSLGDSIRAATATSATATAAASGSSGGQDRRSSDISRAWPGGVLQVRLATAPRRLLGRGHERPADRAGSGQLASARVRRIGRAQVQARYAEAPLTRAGRAARGRGARRARRMRRRGSPPRPARW